MVFVERFNKKVILWSVTRMEKPGERFHLGNCLIARNNKSNTSAPFPMKKGQQEKRIFSIPFAMI